MKAKFSALFVSGHSGSGIEQNRENLSGRWLLLCNDVGQCDCAALKKVFIVLKCSFTEVLRALCSNHWPLHIIHHTYSAVEYVFGKQNNIISILFYSIRVVYLLLFILVL